MLSTRDSFFAKTRTVLGSILTGPQGLALLPAMVLLGYWAGGEQILLAMAIGIPFTIAIVRAVTLQAPHPQLENEGAEALVASQLDEYLRHARSKSLKTACIMIELDDYDSLLDRFGQAAADSVIQRCIARLQSALRNRDKVYHLRDGRFAVAVSPVRQMDMHVAIQMCDRLQSAVEEPVSLDSTTVYLSACVGFALCSQIKGEPGRALSAAARIALRDARRHAPSALRAYSTEIRMPPKGDHILRDEILTALENGEIQPWFQPQLSTETGQITGFEALARWVHPERGLISPAEFLPVLEQNGKMERLGEVMLYNACHALKSWDLAGYSVPAVGVNFSPDELRNPRLVEKIEWELDRFELTPDRLMVEILETVVATSPDDTVARNINGLAALGCPIDLDDFGTGHASISSIRRFAVGRLKIDRSFIMKVDQDAEQQRMVSAILLMAERLELETLAEGVETAGEHAMLAQLGCQHVQGFGISQPMPFDKTLDWIDRYNEKLCPPPKIGRKTG